MSRRDATHAARSSACAALLSLAMQACEATKRDGSGSLPTARVPAAVSGASTNPLPTSVQPDWRRTTLDEAMRVASMFEPNRAHDRVKSRLQRDVAATALDLGMIDDALRYANEIHDWRRGEVLALAAQSLAKTGDRVRAETCLLEASEIAQTTEGWMQERLVTEIGVGFARLGNTSKAREFAARAPQELTGRVEAELSSQVPLEELDRQCDAYDAAIATGSLDIVRSGVEGYFAVWPRVTGDAVRSERAERAIREATLRLPTDIQVDTRIRLADRLITAGRQADGHRELNEAERVVKSLTLSPEVSGPVGRDLALAYLRIGEASRARTLLDAMLAEYARTGSTMQDMDRADYLRPLAEALAAAGDRDGALRAWSLALEAGGQNPNARPRAEDLCLTCLSLVRSGVEPTPAMRSTIDRLRNGLKAPW